jgi:serine/threonine protein kinase
MASNVPAKIGKYDVINVIGRGGMGVVYKAIDPHLDRQVAIKMMTSGFVDSPDLLKRFFREAQSLGSLQHPNIVTVYDLGDFGGHPYLVMEFMEGEGLDAVLAGHRQLSAREKTNIIVQVCNGLSYAHGRGIVHRDIKPANIMLDKDSNVKLFDFGIARIGSHRVTQTGQMVGTLGYMSPEQVNSQPVDARTDLFSTGVVLYQLFTNHLPFEGKNTATTLLKIVNDPPPPLKNFLSSYPPELETILARALAKDREERYHSADEFALDLAQLQVQLKQELIGQHMQEIERYLERSNLYKAKDYLIQVLKVDQQHVKATQLLRDVQARIKKEEVGEQVRKLRQRAEESATREQFETAQEFVEQALAIDKTNTELLQLRESLKAAAMRAQKLHSALRRAETSHQDGELDTAMQAIEEALEIAPDDPQVKTLNRLIQRDWTERSRQRQLENYLFEARQDISSRKFTAALEILKLAEALDPHAPQVHALIESAAAGRDQERRRKDLEAITRDIEDALNRDDYRAACQKAEEGLARFPEERTLVKLKSLADRQRQIEERKQFIDAQLAVSRKLLQEGRSEQLLTLLEAALAKIGPEARLQSLLTIVKENVQRERLEQQRQGVIHPQKEKDHHDSEKHRPEQQRAEHPRQWREDQAEQPKLKPEPLVPFGSASNATRLFETQTPTQNQRAESRDAQQPTAGVLPLLARKVFGSAEKQPTSQKQATSLSSRQEGRPVDQKTEIRTLASINVEGWDPVILHAIETGLAVFVGPLARILVKKSAAKTTDPEALYMLLAESLERESDRAAFLARKSELSKNWSLKGPQVPTEATSTLFAQSSPAKFSPEALDRASRLIAEHVGPIAKVLVRKEARHADSLRALYLRLAEHVQDPRERARFIRDAGL